MFTLIGGAIAYTAALKQVDVQKLDAQFARNATSINNVFELSHTLRVAAINNSSFYEILSKHHQDFHQDILEEYDSDLEKIHTELKFRMLPQCVNSILLITRKAISNTQRIISRAEKLENNNVIITDDDIKEIKMNAAQIDFMDNILVQYRSSLSYDSPIPDIFYVDEMDLTSLKEDWHLSFEDLDDYDLLNFYCILPPRTSQSPPRSPT